MAGSVQVELAEMGKHGILKDVSLAAAVAVLCAGTARGTTETPYLVSQPLASDAGVTVGVNTYLGYGGAGIALLYTAAENCVHTQGYFRDINAASRLGIEVRMVPEDARQSGRLGYTWPLHGDTLRVVLDVTRVPEGVGAIVQEWNQTVVETTIKCMTENAARDPRARYLDIRVEGAAACRELAGQQPIGLPTASPAN